MRKSNYQKPWLDIRDIEPCKNLCDISDMDIDGEFEDYGSSLIEDGDDV